MEMSHAKVDNFKQHTRVWIINEAEIAAMVEETEIGYTHYSLD